MLKALSRGDDLQGVTISGVVAPADSSGDAVARLGLDPAVHALEPAPPRVLDPAALGSLDLPELRAHRRALVAEVARVQRWRRLVRARIDLAVAVAVPVDRIGTDDLVSLQLRRLAADLYRTDTGCGTLLLPGLRDAARALARYDSQLRARLAQATAELVDRYADVPGDVLSAGPTPG